MKYCHQCGAANDDQAVFCKNCGARARENGGPELPKQQPVPAVPTTNVKTKKEAPSRNQSAPAMQQTAINPQQPDPGQQPAPEKPGKKMKKGMLIGILVAALLLVGGIVAGIFFLRWYFSSEQEALRGLESGDLDAVAELVEEDRSLRRDEELVSALKNQIEKARSEYAAGTREYTQLLADLESIEKMEVEAVAEDIADVREYAAKINDSRAAFSTAEALFEGEDYLEAKEQYALVIKEDTNYETAQSKIDECVNKYREKMLADAAGYANEGEYDSAIAVLDTALTYLKDDKALLDQRSLYRKSGLDQEKADVLATAKEYADQGDYASAIEVLDDYADDHDADADVNVARTEYEKKYVDSVLEEAAAKAGEGDNEKALSLITEMMKTSTDNRLEPKKKEYEKAYADNVLAQVDTMLAEGKYDAAKKLVDEALKKIPNNEALTQKSEAIEAAKPVYLHNLEPINGGFSWNEGDPADPFENTYSGLQNYVIFHASGSYHSNAETYSVEYKLDGKYDCLNFTVTPYSDFGASASSYIQVFVNGNHRYTTQWIEQKTEPFSIPTLDISDATYLKIVVHVGGNGCLMLSEAALSNPVGFESKLLTGYTPLHGLNTFNGSLPWHDRYPRDSVGDSYSNVWNYASVHCSGTYHSYAETYSAEYYVNSKYQAISMDIAPADDFGANGSALVKVYVDDALAYTSPALTQKTKRFNTGEISLTGATYVKVVVEVQGNSCTIISNVLLKDIQ